MKGGDGLGRTSSEGTRVNRQIHFAIQSLINFYRVLGQTSTPLAGPYSKTEPVERLLKDLKDFNRFAVK